MKFSDYWAALPKEAREGFAKRVGVQPIYLYQVSIGFRNASPKLARKIHEATNGRVSLAELRPDVYKGVAA